ncbi:TetR family transcriptional regulator [Streptomyces verrucosisporus]|uniref:TetR/AcrR family transcriptional regulator n=1 Tax=Streptomyces verrucosisporus TaxID=1695161 RepID=UPI0019D1604D|nr:TetR family transcriptional regulator [Streptomyces verrucosisporus]MBN3929910.1 TetR family transcriptional regulator [Streptomyces verrucosisporus]
MEAAPRSVREDAAAGSSEPTAAPGAGRRGEPEKAAGPARRPRSEQTRALILETALRLFRERGYDRTTMRAIAQEAGVSVGNAYYYFGSKEHLIQGFYDRITEQHQAAAEAVLDGERDLAARIRGVLLTWLDIAEPYHEFAAQFFKNAADPDSPLSPFSAESEGPREASIEVHRRALAGADTAYDPELAEQLPRLLWLQQMGMVLFWVYDRSEGSANSRRLAERVAPIVARAISLTRFRLLRPLVRETHELLSDFMPTAAGMAANGPQREEPEKAGRRAGRRREGKTEERRAAGGREAGERDGEG